VNRREENGLERRGAAENRLNGKGSCPSISLEPSTETVALFIWHFSSAFILVTMVALSFRGERGGLGFSKVLPTSLLSKTSEQRGDTAPRGEQTPPLLGIRSRPPRRRGLRMLCVTEVSITPGEAFLSSVSRFSALSPSGFLLHFSWISPEGQRGFSGFFVEFLLHFLCPLSAHTCVF